MTEPTQVNVTVTFEIGTGHNGFTYSPSPAEGVTFSGTPTAHASLSANPGKYVFIYQLAGPGLGSTLFWDTSPILWDVGPPPALEPEVTLPQPSAHQIVLGVHNNNLPGQTRTFGFHFKVIHEGQQVESPDPEIVLDPP